MERKFVEKLYTEAGREVSLAYNVLNQTNNWGVTLVAALLGSGFIKAVEVTGTAVVFHYPDIFFWYLAVAAWIIMVRFFARSILGYINMYRWNDIIRAAQKVLSVSQSHPATPIYERNLVKVLKAYYYDWRSPIRKGRMIWDNLKLMYLWFFLIVLGLFIWGVYGLAKDALYYSGLAVFVVTTLLEVYWFYSSDKFQYQKVDYEKEPDITELNFNESTEPDIKISHYLLFGFCKVGPFKHADVLVANPSVKWIPWNYHVGRVDPRITSDVSRQMTLIGRKVALATWELGDVGPVSVLRTGVVDYCSTSGGIMRVNIFLDDIGKLSMPKTLVVPFKQCLCVYAEEPPAAPANP